MFPADMAAAVEAAAEALRQRLGWELPSPDAARWVSSRKAAIVAAVGMGHLTIEQVCEVYSLSVEEFIGWSRSIEAYGVKGLRVTYVRQYRRSVTPAEVGAG
jgi:hypothetical protein